VDSFHVLVDRLFVAPLREYGFVRRLNEVSSEYLCGSESIVASSRVALRLVVEREGVWLGYLCRAETGILQCPLDGVLLDRYNRSGRRWPGFAARDPSLDSVVARDLVVLSTALREVGGDLLDGAVPIAGVCSARFVIVDARISVAIREEVPDLIECRVHD
jgi:hypothetical protein